MQLDTFNKYMVGVQGDSVVILNMPRGPIPRNDALVLAAWIVILAECCTGEGQPSFDDILTKLKVES